jgi:nitrogen-specific signal transduction histidine kinase
MGCIIRIAKHCRDRRLVMQYSDRGSSISLDIEKLIDNLPSAVLVVDYELTIQLANRFAKMFADRLHKDIIGLKPGDAFKCVNVGHAGQMCGTEESCKMCFAVNLVRDLIENQRHKVFAEGQVELVDHGSMDLKVTAINLIEDQAVLVIIDNQTELKKLERDRVVKDKLQAAMETAGAICHEMNQPLQVISGYLDLLMATGLEQDGNSAKYLRISREQLDRLTMVIRKLNGLRRYRTDKYPGGSEILDIAKSSS